MKNLKSMIVAITSLSVVGGYYTLYNKPFENKGINQQLNTEDGNNKNIEQLKNPHFPYGINAQGFFSSRGPQKNADAIKEIFNYDVLTKKNSDTQKDFRQFNKKSSPLYISFMFKSMVTNSLVNLKIHNPTRNTEFVKAINKVSTSDYFSNSDLSKIVFPIKTYLNLIEQYWNETTVDVSKSKGMKKSQLKQSDIDLFKTYYLVVMDWIYNKVFSNVRRAKNVNVRVFKEEWMKYFRTELNSHLGIKGIEAKWDKIPSKDFSFWDLQIAWVEANEKYYVEYNVK